MTPEFKLQGGIYDIEVFYAVHGIAKAGLIYDAKRKIEMVDNYEFDLNSEDNSVSYRIRFNEDSPIRFKIRLTGDAGEGDYVQLLQVHIVSSKLICVYRSFYLAIIFILLDLMVWGYAKYYKNWKPEQKCIFLILSLVIFLFGIPLYRNGLPDASTSDLAFHLNRIAGISKGLMAGQFPVRIQPGWMGGYGYASSIFYGDIFLYIPAIMHMAGFSIQDAYKCYIIVVNLATVLISFFSFRKISRNDFAAMVAAILYAGNIGRMQSIYYESMVGNYSAMMFYPLIIAGFYLIFTEDIQSEKYKRLWILLTMGLTGLLMTHMISCLIIGSYALLCCLVMIKKVFRRATFLEFLKAAGATILINIWFLVPFIQYMLFERLQINSELSQNLEIVDHASYLSTYTKAEKDLYSLFMSDSGIGIGYALIAVLLLYIVMMPICGRDRNAKHGKVILMFSIFALWICTDLFPVIGIAKISDIFVKYFSVIQYQDRFISVAAAFISCLCAIFFASDVIDKKILYVIAGFLCCIVLYQDFRYYETIDSGIYYDNVEKLTYKVGNGEYLPDVTMVNNLTKEIEKDEVLQINDLQQEYLTYDIFVMNPSEQARDILLPVLYYSGYQARDSQSDEMLQVSLGDNGRVAVAIPANYSGTFRMSFRVPWYWRISEMISAITLFLILYYIFNRRERVIKWRSKKLQTPHFANTAG